MNFGGIGLGSYGQGVLNGFGMGSMEEVEALNKALNTGTGVSAGGTPTHSPLIVESLETSLKTLTYSEEHVKLWKKLAKLPAYSTVEEYNQLASYGSDGGGFIAEGQLPATEDSVYQRKHSFVKFLGTTREITHPMTLVRTAHGDIEAQESQNGILWILKKMEHALFWGDSSLAALGAEGIQFDGLNKMVQNKIDLKGKELTDVIVNSGANMVIQNYGIVTDMYLPYQVLSTFSQSYFPKERVIMPVDKSLQAGLVVNKFNTAGGTVEFQPDIFLQATPKMKTTSTGGNQAPTKPATLAVAITSGTEPGEWAKVDVNGGQGTYKYWVTACNRYGESAPQPATADLAMTTGDLGKAVKLTITNESSMAVAPEWFNIYRSEIDGTIGYQVMQVPATNITGGGTVEAYDSNEVIANTYTAFMGEFSTEVIAFKQLAPLMKMDLAIVGPVKRFMVLLYGTPQVYNPNKMMKFTNIKAMV